MQSRLAVTWHPVSFMQSSHTIAIAAINMVKQRKGPPRAVKPAKPDPAAASSIEDLAMSSASDSDVPRAKKKRCPHVKSIKLSKLKSKIAHRLLTACGECGDAQLPSASLWMCTDCVGVNCGRNNAAHALKHYQGAEAMGHSICLNLETLECWCYGCDSDLAAEDIPRVAELRQLVSKAAKRHEVKAKRDAAAIEVKSVSSASGKRERLAHPGLRNLGNTCFFNSVIQCLCVSDVIAEEVEAATVSAPLNVAFRKLLAEMRSPTPSAIVPKELHHAVCQKWKQFKGFHQQDAHEFMRFFLDGLREEQKKFGNDGKDQPGHIDRCFRGKLASVVVCDFCFSCSISHEEFLDLSLPIQTETPTKPTRPSKLSDASISANKHKHVLKMERENKGKGPSREPLNEIDLAEKLKTLTLLDEPSTSHSVNDIDAHLAKLSVAQMSQVEKIMHDRGVETGDDHGLISCLQTFILVENLTETNQFACERCGLLQSKLQNCVSLCHQPIKAPSLANTYTDITEGDQDVNISESSTASSETVVGLSDDEIHEEFLDDFDADMLGPCERLGASASKTATVMRDARKRFLIESSPRILVLHLKRFQQTGRRGGTQKLDTHVSFSETLDIHRFALDEDIPANYRLFGVVEHSGGLHGGHYVAYVLSKSAKVGESVWVYCSDGHVRLSSLEEVLGCQAYILFYERVRE